MPRKHSAQAIPVRTHIRAPDFRKAKSSVSQCVNQKVLFWFQIVGCSDRIITCNPSGVAVERKAIIDSPKRRYAIHNTSIILILLCEAAHPRRLYSSTCGLEIISKHKGRSAACILSFSATLTLLYVWWSWIYSRLQNSPDVSSLRSKAMLCTDRFCCAGCVYASLFTDIWRLVWMWHHVFYFNFTISSYTVQLSTLR